MTDEKQNAAATPDQPVDVAVAAVGDDLGVEAVAGIAVQGNQALIVAQFADMDSAKAAYYALVDAEVKRAIDIDGVLVANADYQGKVHIQKMTDHKTRNGFLWGAVGGAAIGLIFPPTILAGAVYAGVAGAAIGKARNVMMKSDVADELAGGHRPGHLGHRGPRVDHGGRRREADDPGRQGRQVRSGRRRDRRGGQAGRQGCRRRVGRLTPPGGRRPQDDEGEIHGGSTPSVRPAAGAADHACWWQSYHIVLAACAQELGTQQPDVLGLLLWSIEVFFSVPAIWVFIAIFSDIFRRTDIHGGRRPAGSLLIFILPFLGCLIYIMRPKVTPGMSR